MYAENPHLRASGVDSADQGSVSGSVKSDRFDYAEAVDTTSSLSTPTSSNYWDHDHFSKDSLGDTVIHLDKVSSSVPSNSRSCTPAHLSAHSALFFCFTCNLSSCLNSNHFPYI